ncbi:FRG domain-containing protein [Duganella sp. CT11-25]|uniref:FRG domain-containing protein n=1 Tax=unclassified Duganella TaxID=2636909 RepID=UPI0039AF9A05
MKDPTIAWQRLPGSGRRVKLSGSIHRANEQVLERLVRMQHYGLPTRLLDLTHSALVALYFACESKSSDIGEVLCFHRKYKDVCQPSDVPDAALVGIEQSSKFRGVPAQAVSAFRDYLKIEQSREMWRPDLGTAYLTLLQSCITFLDQSLTQDDMLVHVAVLRDIEDALIAFMKQWDAPLKELQQGPVSDQIVALKAQTSLLEFNNALYEEKRQLIEIFCKGMRIQHNAEKSELWKFLQQFTFFFFVFPPINNERIRRQQGAFVICPPGTTTHWPLESHQGPKRIQIQSAAKGKILQELSQLGVNRSYIFPELHELAADAKLRYPATTD